MPALLEAYIDTLNSQALGIGESFESLYGQMASLHDWLDAEGNPGSADVILNMRTPMQALQWAFDDTGGNFRAYLIAALTWINDNWPDGDGAEVTMDAILTAMITADFSQLQKFTGLSDAYRVALWNEPFNAEFYAALARGFMP